MVTKQLNWYSMLCVENFPVSDRHIHDPQASDPGAVSRDGTRNGTGVKFSSKARKALLELLEN